MKLVPTFIPQEKFSNKKENATEYNCASILHIPSDFGT